VTILPATVAGVFRIEMERLTDDRGYFARTWSSRDAEERGLNTRIAQCNVSYNRRRATLRGMHFQIAPHQEAKLVRCVRGALIDVILDLRPDSPTYKKWEAFELTQENGAAVYIPEGCAHGFQTLVDDTEVHYQISEYYAPDSARGVRWNDPAFAIVWPLPNPILSPRDAAYPDFIG
jgi:dTDP-4-dehydrorhamnose 3,5-epimerase